MCVFRLSCCVLRIAFIVLRVSFIVFCVACFELYIVFRRATKQCLYFEMATKNTNFNSEQFLIFILERVRDFLPKAKMGRFRFGEEIPNMLLER
jgi:hypothetical protein